MLKTKVVSSQIKAFLDDDIESFQRLSQITALGGETVSFQFLYTDTETQYLPFRTKAKILLSGELAEYANVRDVRCVPVDRPTNPLKNDAQYLHTEPGLYPDILTPLRYGGMVCPSMDKLRSVWIEVNIPETLRGDSCLAVTLTVDSLSIKVEETVSFHVLDAVLPEQTLDFTQWFYCDCLASYYGIEAFSERHWEIVRNFAELAVKRGRNTLYTPLLTPFLNVSQPYYRTPAQLVKIKVCAGDYSFDFSLVDRWVDMCDAIGVKYFEISHFYQQHEAEHAAHVYAEVDGQCQRIFGWETSASDPEYVCFLRLLLKEFIDHMKKRGDDQRCIYHISDEPPIQALERYRSVKGAIADLLQGYKIIDALCDFEFYQNGIIEHPIPTVQSALPFIEADVPELWVYYACEQVVDTTNCYVAMPSYRTRSLGFQLYKYRCITGFLHWGYNYYNNRESGDAINPYLDLSGEDWVPAGDTFVVYPHVDGTPLESIRMLTLQEALQDYRAMKLAESYYSHEAVVAEIERVLGEPITFLRCAHTEEEMLKIRAAVNDMIANALKR